MKINYKRLSEANEHFMIEAVPRPGWSVILSLYINLTQILHRKKKHIYA